MTRVDASIEARDMHFYQWTRPEVATLLLGIVAAAVLVTFF